MTDIGDSGSEEDAFSKEDWIFYEDRPEWSDVKGVPQYDGPEPVVQIAYSKQFSDVFDYFRAVLQRNEVSDRALRLTTDAISVNASSYHLWQYRRILLKGLKKDLKRELKFSEEVITSHPKNYQVWHHRQVLVEWLSDGSEEDRLTEKIISLDSKNYHAWQHRQWVIQKFNLWEPELPYVDSHLQADIRNNSAWNHRYFVIKNTSGFTEEVLQMEIEYTLDAIKRVPHNESSWNYLRGILQDAGLMKFPNVYEFCEAFYQEGCRSAYLQGFIIDCIEEKLLAGENGGLLQKALAMCDSLASEHDIIRKEYWHYIARNLGDRYGPEEAHSHTKSDGPTGSTN